MALPKNIEWVTFDVYGTLIDWDKGITEAFVKEAARDGFSLEKDQVVPLFHEISREVEGGSYELYAEVLRRTAVEMAKKMDWSLEPSRSGFLPDSLHRWQPFRETNPQLKEFARRIGGKKGWVHVGSSYYHDIEPALKDKIPVVWVNRTGEELAGRKKPDAEVATLAEAAKLLGAA